MSLEGLSELTNLEGPPAIIRMLAVDLFNRLTITERKALAYHLKNDSSFFVLTFCNLIDGWQLPTPRDWNEFKLDKKAFKKINESSTDILKYLNQANHHANVLKQAITHSSAHESKKDALVQLVEKSLADYHKHVVDTSLKGRELKKLTKDFIDGVNILLKFNNAPFNPKGLVKIKKKFTPSYDDASAVATKQNNPPTSDESDKPKSDI